MARLPACDAGAEEPIVSDDGLFSMSRNLALTLIFALCILGPALVIAATGYASIGALGRNPSAAPKILTAMTITLIFVEAVSIVAFLVVWQLFTM